MIRVLHVIGVMDRAGAETFIMNVYRNIDRSKIQFDFLVHTEKEGDYDKEIRQLGGKIYSLPRYTVLNYPIYKKKCDDFFSEHPEYRIVHGHIGSCAPIYLQIAKEHGCFAIAHSHSCMCQGRGLYSFVFSAMAKPVAHIADHFLACSDDAGIDRFGPHIIKQENYQTIKNGIELNKFAFSLDKRRLTRKQLKLGDTTPVFIHVGRFDPVKNHSFLLETFRTILDNLPDSVLLLIGKGELEKDIKKQIVSLNLEKNVLLLGSQPDVSPYLSAADIFIFPSISEGLSISTIEAQASGLPCIVSSGIPDEALVSSHVNKLELELGSSIWARESVLYYQQNQTLLRSRDLRDIEESGYNIADTARQLQQLYEDHSSQFL